MNGRSCRDFAETRSAYVDGHLAEDERQALLKHLSDCAACRQELAELQRLRSMLTDASRRATNPVPAELSDRLTAIAAGTVGQDQIQPNTHRRAWTMSAAGVALVLALLTGVGYVAAPSESAASRGSSDPAGAVRTDFSATLAQMPLSGHGVAAALLVDPSMLHTEKVDLPADPTMAGRDLTGDELATLVERADRSSTQIAYTGVQRVLAPRDSGTTAAEVEIDADPATGTAVRVRTLAGAQVTEGRMPGAVESRIGGSDLLPALSASYQLSGTEGGTLLGRPVTLVEAHRHDNSKDPAARWWIDNETGLVLRQQSFDHAGRLVLAAGYTELEFGASTGVTVTGRSLTDPVTTAAFTTASADRLSSQGWFCHSELAGMSLIRLRADAPEPGVLHMVYTDGLSTVSVFESRGTIAGAGGGSTWDPNLGAFRTDAILNTATWQSGDVTFTVATNGSVALRNKVVAALPHEAPAERTTMERIRAGWSRILERVG